MVLIATELLNITITDCNLKAFSCRVPAGVLMFSKQHNVINYHQHTRMCNDVKCMCSNTVIFNVFVHCPKLIAIQ